MNTRPDDPDNARWQAAKVLGGRLKQTASEVAGLLNGDHPDQRALSTACEANEEALTAVKQLVRDLAKAKAPIPKI